MKKLQLTLVVAILCVVALTGCIEINIPTAQLEAATGGVKVNDVVKRKYEVSELETLIIDAYVGGITITKEEQDYVGTQISKEVRGSDETAVNEAVEKIEFNKSTKGNVLTLTAKSKKILNNKVNSLNSDFAFTIPETVKVLKIISDTGDISITGDYDLVEVDATVGDVTFNGSTKKYDVKLDVGDIALEGNSSKTSVSSNVGDVNLKYGLDKIIEEIRIKTDISSVKVYLPQELTISTNYDGNIKIRSSEIKMGQDGVKLINKSSDMTEIYIYAVEE
jgi:hypothetical protein